MAVEVEIFAADSDWTTTAGISESVGIGRLYLGCLGTLRLRRRIMLCTTYYLQNRVNPVHPHRDPSDPLHRRTLPEGNAMRSCRRGLAHREPRPSRTYYRKRCGLFRIRRPVRPGNEDGEK